VKQSRKIAEAQAGKVCFQERVKYDYNGSDLWMNCLLGSEEDVLDEEKAAFLRAYSEERKPWKK